jgi:hypothetical protein
VRGYDALAKVLRSNLRSPTGRLKTPYCIPAPKFPAAYLWDSAFIAQAWKWWDPTIAADILRPFVVFQAPDGRMPHFVGFGRFTSPLANPPFLEWSVSKLLDFHPDPAGVAGYFYSPAVKSIAWRAQARKDSASGLYFWIDSYESGLDNSPRFRSVDEKVDLGVNHLGAIDLNAEMILQHEAIMKIASVAGSTVNIQGIEEDLSSVRQVVNRELWDEKQHLFGDVDFETGERWTIDTIASYFPLAGDVMDPEKIDALIEHLEDPAKYNTKIPLPTVARDAPEFMKDTWRGPMWVNTAYLVIKGLAKQGHGNFAGDFAYRVCKGVYETWQNAGSFYEFYDPDRYDLKELTRKKGNLYKQIILGSKPVKKFAGWTALANSLLIENVIGLDKQDGDWYLEPHLPDAWIAQQATVRLDLPYYSITLAIETTGGPDNMQYAFQSGAESLSGEIQAGERVTLKK